MGSIENNFVDTCDHTNENCAEHLFYVETGKPVWGRALCEHCGKCQGRGSYISYISEERLDDLHVSFPLLPVRHMAGLSKFDPLDFLNAAEERCAHIVCFEVIFTVDEKCRYPNKMHFARNVPVVVDLIFLPMEKSRTRILSEWHHGFVSSTYIATKTVGFFWLCSKENKIGLGIGSRRHKKCL